MVCHEDCPYSGKCANHQSAIYSRTQNGFTPVFEMIQGEIYCHSCDSKPADETMGGSFTTPLLTDGIGGVRTDELRERSGLAQT